MLYKVKILGEKVVFLRLWMAPRKSCGPRWTHYRGSRHALPPLDAHVGARERRACVHAEGQLKFHETALLASTRNRKHRLAQTTDTDHVHTQ